MALAACADDGDPAALTNGSTSAIIGKRPAGDTTTGTGGGGSSGAAVPTISAKEYFAANIQPTLAATCGGCHSSGPAPVWIAPGDVDKSYALQFQRGYVTKSSAILKRAAHDGGPALTNDQASKYATWLDLEARERGDKAPDSVLAKLATCLDETKFKAIGFDTLVTVTRNADNNPQKEVENADECTGCAQVQCSTCHSADPGTGFMMATGNPVFDTDPTFTEMKSTTPPYLQKYFGMDVNGDPIPSHAIKAKSDATVNTGKANSHPMFVLTPQMESAIDVFVMDAIGKYNTGTCGK
jgi:hypothetical protein